MTGDLRVVVRGPGVGAGRLAVSELARIAGGIQAQLERLALVRQAGTSTTSGRRPGSVVEATRLDLVGFSPGSAVLDLELHAKQLPLPHEEAAVAEAAIDDLFRGLGELNARSDQLPQGFDRGVVLGFVDLTAGLGSEIVEIEVSRPSGASVTLDEGTRATVQALNKELSQEPLEVVGRLHMGDFAPDHLRCRVDTAGGPVACQFNEDLKVAVLGAMNRMVVAQGVAEYWPGEPEPKLLHLQSVKVVGEADHLPLEEVVRLQGVSPIHDADELRGEPVDDFDEFLAAIHEARGR